MNMYGLDLEEMQLLQQIFSETKGPKKKSLSIQVALQDNRCGGGLRLSLYYFVYSLYQSAVFCDSVAIDTDY